MREEKISVVGKATTPGEQVDWLSPKKRGSLRVRESKCESESKGKSVQEHKGKSAQESESMKVRVRGFKNLMIYSWSHYISLSYLFCIFR